MIDTKRLDINPFQDNMTTLHTRSNMRRNNSRQPHDSSDDDSDTNPSTDGSHSNTRKRSRTNSSNSIRRYSDDEEDDNHSQSSLHSLNIDNIASEDEESFEDNYHDLDLTRVDEECEREICKVYRQFGQFIKPYADSCLPYIKHTFAVSSIYLFWITLHFVTAQMYVQFCAYPSLYGFLLSPFLISSPHCAAMRWIFTKGGTLIDGMWIIMGTWLCSKVLYRDV